LARFFGGIILGAAADSYGRKPIVSICLLVISILTLFSAFLPSVHDVTVDRALVVTIIFITLRIVIGFFVGGIWPTAAIFAMEKLYDLQWKTKDALRRTLYEGHYTKDALRRTLYEGCFEELTKKRTRASAIMQSGFHSGYLIAAFISVGLLTALGVPWHGWPVTIWHNSFFSFNDAFPWRTLCFLGGFFGIIWTDYFSISEKNELDGESFQYRKIKSEPPLRALLLNEENKDYRDILFSFWLILTGLLYMYYSVITILPEMLVRNDFLFPLSLSNEDYPLVIILIPISTFGAHIWLGFFVIVLGSIVKNGRGGDKCQQGSVLVILLIY
jgi:MFS family permease